MLCFPLELCLNFGCRSRDSAVSAVLYCLFAFLEAFLEELFVKQIKCVGNNTELFIILNHAPLAPVGISASTEESTLGGGSAAEDTTIFIDKQN